MSSSPDIPPALREAILARPQDVLDDRDMMQALIDTNEQRRGPNVVDLRALAMDRLEERLGRLEDTHASVIAAAYDNVAGTNAVHRAVLRLMEAQSLGMMLAALSVDVAEILRVDAIRLVLEVSDTPLSETDGHGVLSVVEPGFIAAYLAQDGRSLPRDISLRQVPRNTSRLYGAMGPEIGSEACIRLDFGEIGITGLLALGARDAALFAPQQGTDLLAFFGGVVERQLGRWVT